MIIFYRVPDKIKTGIRLHLKKDLGYDEYNFAGELPWEITEITGLF